MVFESKMSKMTEVVKYCRTKYGPRWMDDNSILKDPEVYEKAGMSTRANLRPKNRVRLLSFLQNERKKVVSEKETANDVSVKLEESNASIGVPDAVEQGTPKGVSLVEEETANGPMVKVKTPNGVSVEDEEISCGPMVEKKTPNVVSVEKEAQVNGPLVEKETPTGVSVDEEDKETANGPMLKKETPNGVSVDEEDKETANGPMLKKETPNGVSVGEKAIGPMVEKETLNGVSVEDMEKETPNGVSVEEKEMETANGAMVEKETPNGVSVVVVEEEKANDSMVLSVDDNTLGRKKASVDVSEAKMGDSSTLLWNAGGDTPEKIDVAGKEMFTDLESCRNVPDTEILTVSNKYFTNLLILGEDLKSLFGNNWLYAGALDTGLKLYLSKFPEYHMNCLTSMNGSFVFQGYDC